jgi:hypothetical protein
MAIKDRVEALHRIVGVMAMAVADRDPKFAQNFLEGLEEFSRQSEELGRVTEAAEIRAFAGRFAAATGGDGFGTKQ